MHSARVILHSPHSFLQFGTNRANVGRISETFSAGTNVNGGFSLSDSLRTRRRDTHLLLHQ